MGVCVSKNAKERIHNKSTYQKDPSPPPQTSVITSNPIPRSNQDSSSKEENTNLPIPAEQPIPSAKPIFQEEIKVPYKFPIQKLKRDIYCIKSKVHYKNNIQYSNDNEYSKTITNSKSKDELYRAILSLNERQWIKELMNLSANIFSNKGNMDTFIFNRYLKAIIDIYSHFRLVIEALCSNIEKNDNYEKGVEWKGLYIKSYMRNKAKMVIEEVKAMQFAFFDFLQLVETQSDFPNILFPLIGYAIKGNKVVCVSTIVVSEESENITINCDTPLLASISSKNNVITLCNNYYFSNNKYTNKCYAIVNAYDLIEPLYKSEDNSMYYLEHDILCEVKSESVEKFFEEKFNIDNFCVSNLTYKKEDYGDIKKFIFSYKDVEQKLKLYYYANEIKLKYSIINSANLSFQIYNDFFYRSNYASHFSRWLKMITTNDTQINSLRNLKRNMHRYGINSSMLLITLILLNQNSSNCINLIALIKNSILSKILRDIINSKEEKSNEMRIENILLHINAICAPRLITKKEFSSIYNSLLAHLNAYLFKTRIIDFNLGINVLDDINLRFFCEDLISNARRTTFNFAKCMEDRLNISFNRKELFKFSIQNYGAFTSEMITQNDPIIESTINDGMICDYLFALCANRFAKVVSNENVITQNEIATAIKLNSIKPRISMNNIAKLESEALFEKSEINNITLNSHVSSNREVLKYELGDMPIFLHEMVYKMKTKGNTFKTLSKLKNAYYINSYSVISEWSSHCREVFNRNFHSHLLLKCYMYEIISAFFFANDLSKTHAVLDNINSLTSTKNIYSKLNHETVSVLNLIFALITTDYFGSEKFFSRSLIFSLLEHGDPRGRNCDGDGFMLFPMWKIARKTSILDSNSVDASENFKEMFHSQDFFYKKNAKKKNLFNFSLVSTRKNKKINVCDSVNFANEDIDERPSLSGGDSSEYAFDDKNNFSNEVIDIESIPTITFPPISDIKAKNGIDTFFKSNKFITFLFKQLSRYISSPLHNTISLSELITMKLVTSSVDVVNSNTKKRKTTLSHFVYDELMEQLSFKKNAMNGLIVAFGNNSHNQTANDNYAMLDIPRTIFKLKNENISRIFCGWENSLAITNKGEVYMWGNNKSMQCGVEIDDSDIKTQQISTPVNISRTQNVNFKATSASCGNDHTLLLGDDYTVYGFGTNVDGVLGTDDLNYKSYKLKPIPFPPSSKIISISCGTVHNLALASDGKVFSWGSAQGGQLGLDEKYLTSLPSFASTVSVSKPTEIQLLPSMIRISAGEAHSIALNQNKRIYTWGFGSNGQLGLGFCEDSFEPGTGMARSRVLTPLLLHTFAENVKDVQCGKTFTMFITENNELYGCGVNDLYQLGIKEVPPTTHLYRKDMQCYDFVKPTRIEHFLSMKVEKVACGEGHCLAIVKDPLTGVKAVWSWGNNKYGQLGLGKQIRKSLPKPINWMLGYNKFWFVDDIACGGFHSLCLLKRSGSGVNEEKQEEKMISDFFAKIINEDYY